MSELIPTAGLVVRPGDTLIVGVAESLFPEDADRLKAGIRKRIPGLADVLLITKVTALAAYRPESEEVPTDA